MSGSIEEIPLPDLLQLLSTVESRGVLVGARADGIGKIYLRKGQIYFATIDDSFDVEPAQGDVPDAHLGPGIFDLEPPDERAVLEEIQDSTEGAADGRDAPARRVQPARAAAAAAIGAAGGTRPLEPKLRDLAPEELDVFQVALGAETVRALFDECSLTDLTIAEKLKALIDKGYLIATE